MGRLTLYMDACGEDVNNLKRILKTLGYRISETDDFDIKTRSAVEAFQNNNGLSINGVVDDVTWTALEKCSGINITSEYSENTLEDTANISEQTQDMPKEPPNIAGAGEWNEIDGGLHTAPVVAPITERPTLRMGSTGEYVAILQADLKQLDFYHGAVDGKFGSGTDTGVRNFQISAELLSDGIVGSATWNAIDYAVKFQKSDKPVIEQNSVGSYVVILQRKLKCLGFFAGSITGSFGTETTIAVKAFQKANGLSNDGVVGSKTWGALYEQTACLQTPVMLPEDPRPTLRYGDSGAYVYILQGDLINLMYYTGEITGRFDWKTQVAVKVFQDANGLTPDGIVGRRTWNALNSLYPPPIE